MFTMALKKATGRDVPQCKSYLGDVDASLLERAVIGVLCAYMAVLAPVAWERAVYTGKAAKREKR